MSHAGRTERAVVDQSAVNGWNPVGRYVLAFAAGAGQSVRLDDNTGEAFSDRPRLAFDALRVTPMQPGPIDVWTPRDASGRLRSSRGDETAARPAATGRFHVDDKH